MTQGNPLAHVWHVNCRHHYYYWGILSPECAASLVHWECLQGIPLLCIYCTPFLCQVHARDWAHGMNKTQVVSVFSSLLAWQQMHTWEGCQVSECRSRLWL